MTRETYRKMTGYFLQDEKKVRRIILANRLLTGIVFVSYPLYLISLLLKRDTLLPLSLIHISWQRASKRQERWFRL